MLGETGRVDNELFIARALYESYRKAYGVPKVGDMLVTGVGTLGKVFVVSDNQFYLKTETLFGSKSPEGFLPSFSVNFI